MIDPNAVYPVKTATAHPVHENARVRRFSAVLQASPIDLEELGALVYGSHASYSACGLGSDGTDLLVDLAGNAGASSGLSGQRQRSGDAVDRVVEKYEQLTGRHAQVFSGSSPGAYAFGRMVWD